MVLQRSRAVKPPREHVPRGRAPSLGRRLLCAVYESVILFGVVFIAGYLFSALTQQRNGLTHHNLLAGWITLVVGAYFVWFWTHGGQTLPMKTWRLRLVDHALAPVSVGRAMLRYVLAWLWFLPPLALHSMLGGSVPHTLLALSAWITLWASTQWLNPDRQWLHDRLAGTRIVAAP
ncbi:RDD family protein [Mycetohabitans endofungorum]|uniref:RDD family protein n=1 Tax=Mycetohabitans endofungorum TaxID=417203 RepID=UPI002B05B516|nr:RDD family protein [Mycetohabitans endofungorum]